jgi:flagellar biosynthesis protein FlhF
MRLKTILAPTMAQAIAILRAECGDDAIIVSTEETPLGLKLYAALEEAESDIPSHGAVSRDPLAQSAQDPIDAVHEVLLAHGMPNSLMERVIDSAFTIGADDPLEALIGALGQVFGFAPFTSRGPNIPYMLVGAPGAGKTVAVAKLAARAVLARRKVRLITTDTVRAGGIQQLEAFGAIMNLKLYTAETDRQLARLVEAAAPDEQVLIDTQGVNPYSPRDMGELNALIRATPMEPILVIAGGGDVVDSMEQAEEFTRLGVHRILATRLDMVRRLGSLLAAADSGRLAFGDCSMTPLIADGLTPLDPGRLAAMLLPEAVSAAPSVTPAAARGMKS